MAGLMKTVRSEDVPVRKGGADSRAATRLIPAIHWSISETLLRNESDQVEREKRMHRKERPGLEQHFSTIAQTEMENVLPLRVVEGSPGIGVAKATSIRHIQRHILGCHWLKYNQRDKCTRCGRVTRE